MSKLVTLIAIHKIRLDMETVVSPGKSFECDADAAADYLARGSAKDTSDAEEVGQEGPGDPDPSELTDEQRAERIRETLVDWLDEDPEQANDMRWTKAGTPRNKTLDDAVGFNCTTEEVNPIYDAIQAEREGGGD